MHQELLKNHRNLSTLSSSEEKPEVENRLEWKNALDNQSPGVSQTPK